MAEMANPDGLVHDIQAASEGVDIVGGAEKITFMGGDFRIAEKVGLMPLIKFGVAAKKGGDSTDMDGLAAMYELIRDCIDPGDWDRFERHAIDTKADADELFQVVSDVIEKLSARPTRRPAVSSDGPPSTSDGSKESPGSTAPAIGSAPGTLRLVGDTEQVVTIDELLDRDRLTG